MKAYIFLADGLEEIEAITPIDLLRRAGIEVCTVSVHDRPEITGAHAIGLRADKLYADCDFSDATLLLLPGGMPGTTHLGEHAGLCELLRGHAQAGKQVAAICAAPSVLGRLGLLEGKKATCYPGFEAFLGDSAVAAQVVVDGNFTTGKGPGAAYDFALQLIARLAGQETADRVAAETMYK